MPSKHKTTTLPRQEQSKARSEDSKPNRILAILVVVSIAVAVLGIILLKQQPQDAVTLTSTQSSGPTSQGSAPVPDKSAAAVAGPVRPRSPSDQLNDALAAGQPVLVFMHSNNCQSCIDMMKVVNQVYPEFAGQIALVDVDVYDAANNQLIQTLGLRYIPTVVVFDKDGKASQNVGGMKPDAFRTFLRQRALGS